MTILLQISPATLSDVTDCMVNHELDPDLPILIVHNFEFFGTFQLKYLNLVLLWKTGSNYGLGSSQRKRYLSDINIIKGKKFVSHTNNFKPTKACEKTLLLKGPETKYVNWRVTLGDENYEINGDTEQFVEEPNFCDKFGVIKYGLWKKQRKLCIERGLQIKAADVTISRLSNKHLKETITDPMEALVALAPDICRAREEQEAKEEEIKRQQTPANISVPLHTANLADCRRKISEVGESLASIIAEKERLEKLPIPSPNAPVRGPPGYSKRRRAYFNTMKHLYFAECDPNTAERMLTSVYEIVSKIPPEMGWVTDRKAFYTNVRPDGQVGRQYFPTDPNTRFSDNPPPIDYKPINSKIENLKQILDRQVDLEKHLVNLIAELNKREEERLLELESQRIIDELNLALNEPAISASQAFPKKINMSEKKKVKVLHVGDNTLGLSKGHVLKQDEFKTSKYQIKGKGKMKANTTSLELSNKFACLEYDNDDMINDLIIMSKKSINVVDLFKNRPLYKCIKERKRCIEKQLTEIKAERVTIQRRVAQCARSNIYKSYKLINSFNTLKKALFCARNAKYPSVNKKWADGIPITLKRCQWHYLISSCRIALGLFDPKDFDDFDEQEDDWFDETFF